MNAEFVLWFTLLITSKTVPKANLVALFVYAEKSVHQRQIIQYHFLDIKVCEVEFFILSKWMNGKINLLSWKCQFCKAFLSTTYEIFQKVCWEPGTGGRYIQARHALLHKLGGHPIERLGHVFPACFAKQKQNGVCIGGVWKDACVEKYLRDFAKRPSFKTLYCKKVLYLSCSIQKEVPCRTSRQYSRMQGECQTLSEIPL